MGLNQKHIELLAQTRKGLHANPELSGKELLTQQTILDFLNIHCNINALKVGETGVLVEFKGEITGKNILIRGDIDALPIQEINTFDYKSLTESVSHKCGHDGHTTILLGVAILLHENPIQKGSVFLLFQPSEENGKGAQKVLNDDYFKQLKIDNAFALHNLPGFPMHEIVIKEDKFTSNVKSVAIKLNGKTAHAAEPEKGFNPANTIARILQFAAENTKNDPTSDDFFLITPIHVNMGELAYGISAGAGEVHLTLRSWSTELMQETCNKLERFIEKLCSTDQLQSDITWLEEFYSNNNDKVAVDIIRKAAQSQNLSINEMATPFKWGEDFGLFTQRYKGAMFGLGSGEKTPALHNPDYDFPDEITATGANLFYQIITKSLES